MSHKLNMYSLLFLYDSVCVMFVRTKPACGAHISEGRHLAHQLDKQIEIHTQHTHI